MLSYRFAAGIFLIASIVLFLLSLRWEAYHTDTDTSPSPWECLSFLLIGWMGVADGVIAWFANPALLAAWIFMWTRFHTFALCSAIAALGLALSFLMKKNILTDEAGHRANITGYAAGYWLWITSIASALAGCTAMMIS